MYSVYLITCPVTKQAAKEEWAEAEWVLDLTNCLPINIVLHAVCCGKYLKQQCLVVKQNAQK